MFFYFLAWFGLVRDIKNCFKVESWKFICTVSLMIYMNHFCLHSLYDANQIDITSWISILKSMNQSHFGLKTFLLLWSSSSFVLVLFSAPDSFFCSVFVDFHYLRGWQTASQLSAEQMTSPLHPFPKKALIALYYRRKCLLPLSVFCRIFFSEIAFGWLCPLIFSLFCFLGFFPFS